MKRLLHLSDLHFGRIHADLVEPLVRTVNGLAPDLVAISGDLTQRARVSQSEQAAAFIAELDAPVVSVPGNHDTPLDNIALRFLAPWRRYRRHISRDLEPVVADDHMALVGVNTVIVDDPRLTVRLVPGEDPVPVIVDSGLPPSVHSAPSDP